MLQLRVSKSALPAGNANLFVTISQAVVSIPEGKTKVGKGTFTKKANQKAKSWEDSKRL